MASSTAEGGSAVRQASNAKSAKNKKAKVLFSLDFPALPNNPATTSYSLTDSRRVAARSNTKRTITGNGLKSPANPKPSMNSPIVPVPSRTEKASSSAVFENERERSLLKALPAQNT